MGTERIEIGMYAKSKAGHDKDTLYVIMAIENEYVHLVDGKSKPLARPKKKKLKHIQIIHDYPQELHDKITRGEKIIDEDIKRAIKLYKLGR